eukprot:COSAG01_NODE_16036_length_1275_cov_48.571429_3_plen_53_part_01
MFQLGPDVTHPSAVVHWPGAVLQHVDASAAVVHVVPAQSVLSLLESLTLPEPH